MGTIEVGIIVGVVFGILFAIIKATKKNKKKKAATKSLKVDDKAKSEPAKADTLFKIERKGKVGKVSKKALQTNSRTATIEKVFAKQPNSPVAESDLSDIGAENPFITANDKQKDVGDYSKIGMRVNHAMDKMALEKELLDAFDELNGANPFSFAQQGFKFNEQKNKDFDYSDMVVAEAILNPKYKTIHKK